jgi:phage terminase large subunit GpA-like protein
MPATMTKRSTARRGEKPQVVDHAWHDDERDILTPRPRMKTSEWAPKYRYLTQGPLLDGAQGAVGGAPARVRWSNEAFPPHVDIMDAIDAPRWPRVALISPPQAFGKTDCAFVNTMVKRIWWDRQDCLYVSANQKKAGDQWGKKFEPAFRAIEDEEHVHIIPLDRDAAGGRTRRDFIGGQSLFLAGAESVGNVSASTIPFVGCDDVQAMPALIGAFGHTVDVAAKRSQAFQEESRKLVLAGTAGTVDDYLWREIIAGTHFVIYLPCLGCGTWQWLDWERMVFDDRDPLAALQGDVWLRCVNEACDHRITDDELPAMLQDYRWVARGQSVDAAGVVQGDLPPTRIASFWANAFYWPWGSWASHAAAWVESEGDPDKRRDFNQHVLVIPEEPPKLDDAALTPEMIAEHVGNDHLHLVVPAEADMVLLTADVHDRFLYYDVSAWRKEDGASWLIDAGTMGVHGPKSSEKLSDDEHRARVGQAIRKALEDLWQMEREGWVVAGEDATRRMHASAVAIDGGYRPDVVGPFVAQRNIGITRSKWNMIKGESGGLMKPIWPEKPRRMSAGGVYWPVNVDAGKHMVRELLVIPEGKPGRWTSYVDRDLSKWNAHLASEEFVPKSEKRPDGPRWWQKRKGGGPNHWLDCRVYQVALAIAMRVKLQTLTRPPEKKPAAAGGEERGGGLAQRTLLRRGPVRRRY